MLEENVLSTGMNQSFVEDSLDIVQTQDEMPVVESVRSTSSTPDTAEHTQQEQVMDLPPIELESPNPTELNKDTGQELDNSEEYILPELIKPRSNLAELKGRDYDYSLGAGDALISSVKQWDTTSILKGLYQDTLMDRVNQFGEADPDFNLLDSLEYSGKTLTNNEYNWITGRTPRNQKEFDYFLAEVDSRKEDYKAMGQSPIASFVIGMVDPAYLAGGYVGGVVGKTIGVGRVGSAILAGTSDTAVMSTAMHYNPDLTIGDVAGNALLGAGFGFAFGAPRRVDSTGATRTSPEGHREPVETPVTDYTFTPDTVQSRALEEASVTFQDNIPHEFRESTYTQAYGTELKVDPYGVAYAEAKQGVIIDTPHGFEYVNAIRKETHTVNSGDTNINNWSIKQEAVEDWQTRSYSSGIPNYKDIDWEVKNVRGDALKDTAFHQVYKNLENPKVNPALKKLSEYQILTSANSLRGTKADYSIHGKAQSRDIVGFYETTSDTITLRDYRNLKDQFPFTVNHEAMHSLTAHKLNYGKANPSTAHGQIYSEMDSLLKHIKQEVQNNPKIKKMFESDRYKGATDYALSSVHELMSSVAELSNPQLKGFRKILDNIELTPELKAGADLNISKPLQLLMDGLRKLLGLNLSEANALYKALKLNDALLQTPEVKVAMPDGTFRTAKLDSPTYNKEIYDIGIEEAEMQAKTLSESAGMKVAWNGYKTFANWDKGIADVMLNDPLGSNAGNVQDLKQAYRTSYVDNYLVQWEELLQAELKDTGMKWYDRVINTKKIREHQENISTQITEALILKEVGLYNPKTYDASPRVKEMIELQDQFGIQASKDLVEKGLLPAEVLDGNGGYFTRTWDGSGIVEKIENISKHFNGDFDKALDHMSRELGKSLRYTGLDDTKRYIYARSLIDRAMAKADNTDLNFRGHLGLDTAHEIRRQMEKRGVDSKTISDIMDTVEGKIAQAGKDKWQKTRMDLNMMHTMDMPDGTKMPVHELLDKRNVFQGFDRYLEDISGRLALADHGLMSSVDIDKMQDKLLRSAKSKGENVDLVGKYFDDVMNATLGKPVGEVLQTQWRIIGGLTQMMALRNSGFWQVTELAKAYSRGLMTVGLGKTNKAFFKAFGDYSKVKDPKTARQLEHIMSRKSWNDVRLRPLVHRFEDGHINTSNAMASLQQGQGMIYHVNGMVAVQRMQANFASNILVTTLEDAVRGNTKASKYMARAGIDSSLLKEVGKQIDQHGLSVDLWDAKVWAKVNPALTKIMDTDVLRSRTGDVPLIFQFSEAGRILGTFQNFTLTAHNKILANTLVNDGIKGAGLMTAVQLPLALLMTQASAVSGGRGYIDDPFDWVNASLAQMGSFGAFTEVINIVTGNSKGFGSAFTISVDRAFDVFGKASQGNFAGATESAVRNLPLIGLIPGWGLGVSTVMSVGEDDK